MRGRRRRVAVDGSDGWLRLVVVEERQGRPEVVAAVVRNLNDVPEPQRPDAVRRLLGSVCRGTPVRLCVPEHRTLLESWRLPSHDDGEISGLASLEMVRRFPYHAETLAWGYQIASRDADGYATLWMAIAPLALVEEAVRLMEAAGSTVAVVAPGAVGVHHWFRRCAEVGTPDDAEAVAVVEIEAMAARIVIETSHGLAVAREATLQGLAEGGWQASLLEEVQQTIVCYRRESAAERPPVRRIVVTGLPHLVQAAADLLQERLSVPSIVRPALAGDRTVGHAESSASLAALAGLALAEPETLVNLLPEAVVARERARRLRRASAVALGAAFVTVATLLGSLAVTERIAADRVAWLQCHLAERRAVTERLLAAETAAESVRVWRQIGLDGLEMLAEIGRSTPAGVSLMTLSYDRARGEVSWQGVGGGMEPVLAWVQVLRQSSRLSDARLRYARRRHSATGVEFLIECRLPSAPVASP